MRLLISSLDPAAESLAVQDVDKRAGWYMVTVTSMYVFTDELVALTVRSKREKEIISRV